MKKKPNISENIRKGKYIISLSNVIASIIFVVVYLYVKNMLVLILAVLLIVTAFIGWIYFSKIENKYSSYSKEMDESN